MQANSTEQDFTPDDPRVFDQYLQDGVICLRNVLNESWLTRLKEGTRDAIEQGGPHHFRFGTPNAPGFFFGDVMLWQRWPSFCEFAFDGPLASLAGHLMNSQSVTFYHDFLLVKDALLMVAAMAAQKCRISLSAVVTRISSVGLYNLGTALRFTRVHYIELLATHSPIPAEYCRHAGRGMMRITLK